MSSLQEKKSKSLDIFCEVLANNENVDETRSLWDRYLQDFIQYKILSENTDYGHAEIYLMKLLQEYFGPLKQEHKVVYRIISLHVHINLNHLHLARIIRALYSINQFFKTESSYTLIRPMEHDGGTIACRQKDLAIYIATDMFEALSSAIESEAHFQSWYEGYFNVVSSKIIVSSAQ